MNENFSNLISYCSKIKINFINGIMKFISWINCPSSINGVIGLFGGLS